MGCLQHVHRSVSLYRPFSFFFFWFVFFFLKKKIQNCVHVLTTLRPTFTSRLPPPLPEKKFRIQMRSKPNSTRSRRAPHESSLTNEPGPGKATNIQRLVNCLPPLVARLG